MHLKALTAVSGLRWVHNVRLYPNKTLQNRLVHYSKQHVVEVATGNDVLIS